MRGIFSCGGGIALEAARSVACFRRGLCMLVGRHQCRLFVAGQAAYSVASTMRKSTTGSSSIRWRVNEHSQYGFPVRRGDWERRKPLDVEKVLSSPTRLRISITDANTGAGFLVDDKDSRHALLDSLRCIGDASTAE